MTAVTFFTDEKALGFCVRGHSSKCCDDSEGKLVCAAVSSAVYMAANTLTDVVGQACDIAVDDAAFTLRFQGAVKPESKMVLDGLKLHLTQLSEQYSKRIHINTEV